MLSLIYDYSFSCSTFLPYLILKQSHTYSSKKQFTLQRYVIILNFASIYQKKLSMRQPIKKVSRVPAYQNGRKPSVSAVFCVASSPCGEALVGRMSLCFFLYARESKRITFLFVLLCVRVKNILAQQDLARCAYFAILIQSHHSSIPAISPDSQISRYDLLSLSAPVRPAASPHSPPASSFLPASSVSMSSGRSQSYNKVQS